MRILDFFAFPHRFPNLPSSWIKQLIQIAHNLRFTTIDKVGAKLSLIVYYSLINLN